LRIFSFAIVALISRIIAMRESRPRCCGNRRTATGVKQTARWYKTEDVRLNVVLRSRSREIAETMLWEVESLLCCGPAGGAGFRGSILPSVMTKSVLISRDRVKPSMEVFVA
jgi:hypothetical protein